MSLTWIFLGSLDVLSIGFGNENDLHGLMKLSALSPLVNWGGGWLHYVAFQGRRLDLSNLVIVMIDEFRWDAGGCIAFVLGLLGFSKSPHSPPKVGHPSFSFISLCVCVRVHAIVVFPFLLQIPSGCIHRVQILLIGGGIDCRDLLSVPFAFASKARVPENYQNA